MNEPRREGGPLRELLADSIRPNHLPDVAWLQEYLAGGAPAGEPMMLSLGETWDHTPAALLQALREVPSTSHGYQISMYGLPLLRNVLKEYVADTQRLPRTAEWEVAVGWTGTRSAMRDFAVLVARERAAQGLGPGTVLAVAPAWDYAGFAEPLGFTTAYVPFDPAAADGPSPADVRTAVAGLPAGELSVVVVNAQHNPTGANWSPQQVEALLDAAAEHGAAVLVDDAYYGVCPPGETVTSALEILLSRPHDSRGGRWLGVRSLGKQFHCNGWALGALIAAPDTLDTLVNDLRPQHTFNYAIHLQWAMAQWLADRPAVEEYLRGEQAATAEKRAAVLARLAPDSARRAIAGPAAPYVLFPVPDGMELGDHLRRCVLECGVLLSDAWPLARTGSTERTGYARMYLGPDLDVLMAAVDRLEAAKLWPGPADTAGRAPEREPTAP
ncbi:pyridoxal phosphate-dependent aminotransferase [Streptantibioticus silvisoli]|uniref:Pyridoxal phosphate-dependent aminotransferase n=1 Tax=Streptantibioticus silvisoli TaxID=2705255 RepID=A0ABT6VRK8_9ACTN|nr:pyridoxal phosphate-dependent aminotransferase [Streptantibioticus silvisoli]MDI5961132.1 pyridoxal phosphate-dependent aminotransferase [Streptantibioticus silvisoli]